MADSEKKGRGKGAEGGEGKTDKRRLSYLKIRARELKKEQQAVKVETDALRAKLGVAGKGKGKKGKQSAGDEDED
jgi:hypothetical protein